MKVFDWLTTSSQMTIATERDPILGVAKTPTKNPASYQSQAKSLLIFSLAAILRLMLLNLDPAWAALLAQRVELTNSFVGLAYIKEVGFLLRMKVKVYDYGTCLPMPLVVGFIDSFSSPLLEKALLIVLDLTVALYLWRIARIKFGSESTVPLHLTSAYLFNPLTLLSGGARSIASFSHLFMIAGLYYALMGDRLTSLSLAAVGTYASVHPIAILGPILTLLSHKSSYKDNLSIFCAALTVLLVASLAMTGSWRFLLSSLWSRLTYASLKPNLGLYWYLFIEIFDFFRPLFAAFLQIHSLFYTFPTTIRFKNDPLFMAFLVIALQAIFQPYPTAAEAGLLLSMLLLFPEISHLCKVIYPALVVLLFSCVLTPINWYYWIHQGSGNANFYYATTSSYNISLLLIVGDMARAHLVTQILKDNPKIDIRKVYQK